MNLTTENTVLPLLDTVEAIDNLGGDTDLYRQVVELFRDDANAQLAALESALTSGDYPTGRRVAHTLKGTAASVGALRLRAAAYALESACANGNPSAIANALPALKDEIGAAHRVLGEFITTLD